MHKTLVDIKPKIRFRNYTENWNFTKLSDVVVFFKGKGISKEDTDVSGANKCIRYGELYTDYSEIISHIKSKTDISDKNTFLSNKYDVLIPSSGETAIDIAKASCVLEDGVYLGGDINVLRPTNQIYGPFLSFYLTNKKKMEIAKLSQGYTVAHLYSSQLKNLKIKKPSYEEQEKIVEFLSKIDNYIQNLKSQKEELEKYKKGMMQKIFSQEIRFKDDNGNDFPDWERISLEKLLRYEQPTRYLVKSTEYDDSYATPVLTAGKTFILGHTDEKDGIFERDNLPVIIFDDFTIAHKFVDFPFKVKSSAMKILLNKDAKLSNIRFIFYRMSSIKFSLGEEHKRYWISEYSKTKIDIPCVKEQIKITEFLKDLDRLIASKKIQIQLTEHWKKGLMQEMFV